LKEAGKGGFRVRIAMTHQVISSLDHFIRNLFIGKIYKLNFVAVENSIFDARKF